MKVVNLFYYSAYFCYNSWAFFGSIYESYYTILANFYIYLQYF